MPSLRETCPVNNLGEAMGLRGSLRQSGIGVASSYLTTSSLSRVRTHWQVTENSGAKDNLKSMNLSLAVFPEVVFHCHHVSNNHACRKAGTFWNQAYLKWWKFRLERVLDFDHHAGCHDPTPYIKYEYVIWKQYPQLSVFGKKYVASLFIIPKSRNLAFEHVTSVLTMLGRFQSLYGHPKLPRMRDVLCPSLPWICNRCCRDHATCDSGSYLARGETRWIIHQPNSG